MSKKFLAFLLAFVMVVGMLPVSAFAADAPDGQEATGQEAKVYVTTGESNADVLATVVAADPAATSAAAGSDNTQTFELASATKIPYSKNNDSETGKAGYWVGVGIPVDATANGTNSTRVYYLGKTSDSFTADAVKDVTDPTNTATAVLEGAAKAVPGKLFEDEVSGGYAKYWPDLKDFPEKKVTVIVKTPAADGGNATFVTYNFDFSKAVLVADETGKNISNVKPAILNKTVDAVKDIAMQATAETNNGTGVVTVKVATPNGTKLPKHANGTPTPVEGYWCGFALTAPEGAAKVNRYFSKDAYVEGTSVLETKELEDAVDSDGNKGYTFYVDADPSKAADQKLNVAVQWVYDDGSVGKVTVYKIDLSGVDVKTEITATVSKVEATGADRLTITGTTASGSVDPDAYAVTDTTAKTDFFNELESDGKVKGTNKFVLANIKFSGLDASKSYKVKQTNNALKLVYPNEADLADGVKEGVYTASVLSGGLNFMLCDSATDANKTVKFEVFEESGNTAIATVNITNNVTFTAATIGEPVVETAFVADGKDLAAKLQELFGLDNPPTVNESAKNLVVIAMSNLTVGTDYTLSMTAKGATDELLTGNVIAYGQNSRVLKATSDKHYIYFSLDEMGDNGQVKDLGNGGEYTITVSWDTAKTATANINLYKVNGAWGTDKPVEKTPAVKTAFVADGANLGNTLKDLFELDNAPVVNETAKNLVVIAMSNLTAGTDYTLSMTAKGATDELLTGNVIAYGQNSRVLKATSDKHYIYFSLDEMGDNGQVKDLGNGGEYTITVSWDTAKTATANINLYKVNDVWGTDKPVEKTPAVKTAFVADGANLGNTLKDLFELDNAPVVNETAKNLVVIAMSNLTAGTDYTLSMTAKGATDELLTGNVIAYGQNSRVLKATSDKHYIYFSLDEMGDNGQVKDLGNGGEYTITVFWAADKSASADINLYKVEGVWGTTAPVVKTPTVVPAPMADNPAAGETARTDLGTVTAAIAKTDVAGTYNVTLTGSDIVMHKNALGNAGYWVGFGMPIESNSGAGYTYTLKGATEAENQVISTVPGRVYEKDGKFYNTIYFDEAGTYTIAQAKDGSVVATYVVKVTIAKKTYTVTVTPVTGATITAKPTSAVEGATITVTVTPPANKLTKAVTVKNGTADVSVTAKDESTYTFTMPAGNVTVTAAFADPVSVEAKPGVAAPVVNEVDTTGMDETTKDLADSVNTAVKDSADKISFTDTVLNEAAEDAAAGATVAKDAVGAAADTITADEDASQALKDVAQAIKDNDDPDVTIPEGVSVVTQVYMDVEVAKVEVKDGVSAITFEITPKAQNVLTTTANAANPSSLVVYDQTNASTANAIPVGAPKTITISKPTEITLPLPADFANADNVWIKLDKGDSSYFYQGAVANADNTLTFTSENGFGSFTVYSDAKGAGLAAMVGKNGYATVQAAIDAVADNGTVTLLTAPAAGTELTIAGDTAKTVNFALGAGVTAPVTLKINGKDVAVTATGGSFTYTPAGAATYTVEEVAGSIGSKVTITGTAGKRYIIQLAKTEDGTDAPAVIFSRTAGADGKVEFYVNKTIQSIKIWEASADVQDSVFHNGNPTGLTPVAKAAP